MSEPRIWVLHLNTQGQPWDQFMDQGDLVAQEIKVIEYSAFQELQEKLKMAELDNLALQAQLELEQHERRNIQIEVELYREHKKQDGKKIDLLNSRIAYLTGENVHSVELWKQESLKQDEDVCHE